MAAELPRQETSTMTSSAVKGEGQAVPLAAAPFDGGLRA